MGWALLLFCPAIISQPKHFAQKNSSTQINLLGKVETSKTSKSCFFRIASSKEFYKKTHWGHNCERYCSRNHLFSEEQSPGATRGFLQKGEKSQRKHKNTFQNQNPIHQISERQNNVGSIPMLFLVTHCLTHGQGRWGSCSGLQFLIFDIFPILFLNYTFSNYKIPNTFQFFLCFPFRE